MQAILDKIVIEVIIEDHIKETDSGLVTVENEESMNKKPLKGTVVSHGPGRQGAPMHESVKIGAEVWIPRFAGHEVVDNGVNYRVVIQQDVLFVY